jgi:hypothetical protein
VITVGETVLEFLGPEQGTQLLVAPAQTEAELERQAIERQEAKKRARSLVDPFGLGAPSGTQRPGPGTPEGLPKAAKLGLAAAGAIALMIGYELSTAPKKPAKVKLTTPSGPSAIGAPGSNDVGSLLTRMEPPATNKTAEMFYRQGFREFIAGNYMRARTQFELVLQVVPDHEMAKRYRENCNHEIEQEVKVLMEHGKRNLDSGKLRESKGQYEAVLRLLAGDQSNPAFKEAQDQLEVIRKEVEKVD